MLRVLSYGHLHTLTSTPPVVSSLLNKQGLLITHVRVLSPTTQRCTFDHPEECDMPSEEQLALPAHSSEGEPHPPGPPALPADLSSADNSADQTTLLSVAPPSPAPPAVPARRQLRQTPAAAPPTNPNKSTSNKAVSFEASVVFEPAAPAKKARTGPRVRRGTPPPLLF